MRNSLHQLLALQLILSLVACAPPSGTQLEDSVTQAGASSTQNNTSKAKVPDEIEDGEKNKSETDIEDSHSDIGEDEDNEENSSENDTENPSPQTEATPPPSNSSPPSDSSKVSVIAEGSKDTLSNGKLTLVLDYQGKLELENSSEDWGTAHRKPYVDAGIRWLSALTGVDGKDKHQVTMKINVKKLDVPADGTASVEETETVGENKMPISGELNINNSTYAQGFDQSEFRANIFHEIGHVFGFGESSSDFVVNEPQNGGNIFRVPNSKAVEMYQEIYGVSFDFVPMSDNGAHLYDHKVADDQKRTLPNGKNLPPLTQEFMANGKLFGKVSLGIFDDIGYQVNYSQADPYTP